MVSGNFKSNVENNIHVPGRWQETTVANNMLMNRRGLRRFLYFVFIFCSQVTVGSKSFFCIRNVLNLNRIYTRKWKFASQTKHVCTCLLLFHLYELHGWNHTCSKMFWHIITKYIGQFNTVYLPKSPKESNNREFPKPIDPKQLSGYKLAPVGSTSFLLCISSRKRASERAQLPKASDEVDVTFRPLERAENKGTGSLARWGALLLLISRRPLGE